jgi:hypothetical protein
MNKTSNRRVVALLPILIALALLALTRAGGDGGAQADRPSPAPMPTRSATGGLDSPVNKRLTSAFGVLRGGASVAAPGKAVDKALKDISAPGQFALNRDSLRQISDVSGHRGWTIGGQEVMCLLVENSEGIGTSCGSVESALAGKIAIGEHSTVGGADTVVGLVPDGSAVTRKDNGRAVSSKNNGYMLRGAKFAGVTIRAASGRAEIDG